MRKVIWLFYGFQFFFALLVWLPIYYQYQKVIGLSDYQIFLIQSIYYIVFCLIEVPTGLAADFWGYRRCLYLGGITLTLSGLVAIFFQSFTGFLFHFLLIALARSLVSGAGSAYIYEYLQQSSRPGLYKDIEGKARAYGLIGKVVCWSGVGFLMQWNLTSPYWLTVLFSVLSVYFALLLPDVSPLQLNSSNNRIEKLKKGLHSLAASHKLIFLMCQGIAIFVLARICQVNLFQPILESKHFAISALGPVMAMMTVFEALGSLRPGWIRRYLSDVQAVFVLTAIMGLSILAITGLGRWGTLVSLAVFSVATGFSFPIQRQVINDAIKDSSFRATFISIESILDRAVCAGVAYIIALYLSGNRLNEFLATSGVLTLLLMGALMIMYHYFFNRRSEKYL